MDPMNRDIIVTFFCSAEHRLRAKCRPTTSIRKLIKTFMAHGVVNGVDVHDLRFLLDGERLSTDETVTMQSLYQGNPDPDIQIDVITHGFACGKELA